MSEINRGEINSVENILSAKQYNTNADVIDVDQTSVKLVVFTLAGNWFAFESENIKEILSDMAISALPGCPASLEGVINVRGDIESVISLRKILHIEPMATTVNSRILIGATESMRSGIRVDTVEEIITLSEKLIQSAPATLPDYMNDIVTGVFTLKKHTVTVLDLSHMFKSYHDALMG